MAEYEPIRVGIPRALLYYRYYPMWRTFFERLGAEVVVPPPTTRQMVNAGSSRVVAETCLPTKVYLGHVMSLVGSCDCVFVPAVRSVEERAYNCSKFLGLPDLTKAVVPNCPEILTIDIDVNKGKRDLYAEIYRLGRRFTWNPLSVRDAAKAAFQTQKEFQDLTSSEQITIPQALDRMAGKKDGQQIESETPKNITIVVIGHPYIIHDEYVNHRLLTRLGNLGAKVVTSEMATVAERQEGIKKIIGRPYWLLDDEVTGAAGHYLHQEQVKGIIIIETMACGPDSIMIKGIELYAKKKKLNKPIMKLTIDEHTGEAGLVTRLEAYWDLMKRRKKS